jgi:hypothetical protein
MKLDYQQKEIVMQQLFASYKSPAGFRSTYKAVPIVSYDMIKQFIDFTKYFVMFRGPRPNYGQSSTRKRDAHSFDVYQRDARTVNNIRIEREAFNRGVQWANNRSH